MLIELVHYMQYLLIFQNGMPYNQIKNITLDGTKSGLLDGILQSDLLAPKGKLFQSEYILLSYFQHTRTHIIVVKHVSYIMI